MTNMPPLTFQFRYLTLNYLIFQKIFADRAPCRGPCPWTYSNIWRYLSHGGTSYPDIQKVRAHHQHETLSSISPYERIWWTPSEETSNLLNQNIPRGRRLQLLEPLSRLNNIPVASYPILSSELGTIRRDPSEEAKVCPSHVNIRLEP